ncbi:carboxyl transferase domain-containing protein [Salinisphaera sp. T31B1]|uniref:carboxyl transferase domain-containing protein n=1 Tax=Salinisphaera sp. T31B1 TaxID=727963 RepID=UPI0033427F9C
MTDFLACSACERVAALAGDAAEHLVLKSTLSAAMGSDGDHRYLVAATDPTVTSGAIGVAEALDLRALIERARRDTGVLVLVIDSAGARVSEGVAIQGGLRRLFAELFAARAGGLRSIAILGRNVFGGASMLAMACDLRVYAERTRLAMTGPAVIQNHNDVGPATVGEAIGSARRLEHDTQGMRAGHDGPTGLRPVMRRALAQRTPDFECWRHARDSELRTRLGAGPAGDTGRAIQVVDPGTIKLVGQRLAGPHDVMQLIDTLNTLAADGDRIVIDCEWACHSMALADEQRLLSQYLVHLGAVIHSIEAHGTRVCLRIAQTLSGGLYIALASAVSDVRLAAGARVLTLPQDILDAFVKQPAAPELDAGRLVDFSVIDTIEPSNTPPGRHP